MCCPVCEMVLIKYPLLLIKKSRPCGDSRFPLSLSMVLYHITVIKNVLSVLLNKTCPSFSDIINQMVFKMLALLIFKMILKFTFEWFNQKHRVQILIFKSGLK